MSNKNVYESIFILIILFTTAIFLKIFILVFLFLYKIDLLKRYKRYRELNYLKILFFYFNNLINILSTKI